MVKGKSQLIVNCIDIHGIPFLITGFALLLCFMVSANSTTIFQQEQCLLPNLANFSKFLPF